MDICYVKLITASYLRSGCFREYADEAYEVKIGQQIHYNQEMQTEIV